MPACYVVSGFRVLGLKGLGFKVCLGLAVWGSGFGCHALYSVPEFEFRVDG